MAERRNPLSLRTETELFAQSSNKAGCPISAQYHRADVGDKAFYFARIDNPAAANSRFNASLLVTPK